MKKIFYFSLFLSITISAFGQEIIEDYWVTWDANYREVDVISLFEFEKLYADSIRRNPDIPQYYVRIDKYRFQAEYLGEVRVIDEEVKYSMKRVLKFFIPNSEQYHGLMGKELLFRVGQEYVWMPIQSQLLEYFKKEIEKGATVMLYCLFLGEHLWENVLYKTLFISEFY